MLSHAELERDADGTTLNEGPDVVPSGDAETLRVAGRDALWVLSDDAETDDACETDAVCDCDDVRATRHNNNNSVGRTPNARSA